MSEREEFIKWLEANVSVIKAQWDDSRWEDPVVVPGEFYVRYLDDVDKETPVRIHYYSRQSGLVTITWGATGLEHTRQVPIAYIYPRSTIQDLLVRL